MGGQPPRSRSPSPLKAALITNAVSKQLAEVLVTATLETRIESLHAGESIEIRGLCSFRLRQRRARLGRNPRTGEEVQVPAKRVCYFKPGKTLRQL